MHNWNKNHLQGSLKSAIVKKEEDISRLYEMDGEDNLEEIVKAEYELEDLPEEEEAC